MSMIAVRSADTNSFRAVLCNSWIAFLSNENDAAPIAGVPDPRKKQGNEK
jgi:hypothetical protein